MGAVVSRFPTLLKGSKLQKSNGMECHSSHQEKEDKKTSERSSKNMALGDGS